MAGEDQGLMLMWCCCRVSTQRSPAYAVVRTHHRPPANRKGVIREEKYGQQKDRVMTTGDCMNKNTDPVFIQEIQRMDPCAAHTSQTLQPTRRPRRSTESTGVILIIFCREVLAKEG